MAARRLRCVPAVSVLSAKTPWAHRFHRLLAVQAAREKMQTKSFKAWINMHLAKRKLKVEVRRGATPGLGVGCTKRTML